MERVRSVVRILLALMMIGVGIGHFVDPAPFIAIVPAWLPAPALLVQISGAAEIAGGVGLMVPPTRRAASWGLIALYVAIFPANVNMAIHEIQPNPDMAVPVWAMWARLPFQALLIGVAWWVGRETAGDTGELEER